MLRVTLLLLQETWKYSSAQWQSTDTKTITVDALARAQQTCTKRSDNILTIIPQFNTEDLPHLIVEFIENIKVIGLTTTILHTTDIRNVTIISLSIVQCPRELACTKIVYETVEIPPAIHPARNYRKRKLFAKRQTSTAPTVTDLPPPFVAMSNDHIESLKQISSTLQSTLETTNQVYRTAMDKIPNMETTFALMRNSMQGLATQLVDINKSFRMSGQQLQSRSDALNHAVMMLTEDIDKLRVLARNI